MERKRARSEERKLDRRRGSVERKLDRRGSVIEGRGEKEMK